MRLLIFHQIFLSPQMKRYAIITYKHGIYKLPHELSNDLGLRILGNYEMSANRLNLIQWSLSILAMRMCHFPYWKTVYGCSLFISLLRLHFGLWNKFFYSTGTLHEAKAFTALCLSLKSAIIENSRHRINQFGLFTIDENRSRKNFPRNHAVLGLFFEKLFWGQVCIL